MTATRIAVAAGIALLTAFVVVVILAGPPGLGAAVGAAFAIVVLVAAGNLLYGRNSHYAAAQARLRPPAEPSADPGGPDAAP
jgi:threonine/homoserine/homoserine lactone efflux protein